ncbi:transcriptional regulator [Nocardia farcinica]|uniref:PaaX family transcriptional regulator C-terminal domain-containing protein n=1 Tax=Nocardia farcinica TaxID=37329 RepID=UPI00189560F6|nr:PaaX family transcriptional regulator C-terminal domain-containing protein [Nocardia farcinica]MBF6260099.1 transcriptional regulator [Nocardia farcinica]
MGEGQFRDTDISTRTLVESLVREDATIDAGELYDVANALGMSDQQVRLCIKRLVAEGRFVHEGRGRKAVLRATELTRNSLEPDLEFVRYMYAQDRGQVSWDGRWHLAAFGVPESVRHARDSMRETILRLGGAPIHGGLYVSANPWEQRIRSVATQLDVIEHITTFTSTDLTIGRHVDPRDIAEHLWPLDRIADGHQRLLVAAEHYLRELRVSSTVRHLTIAVALAAEFTRAMEPDPLLPPQLLPQPWAGAAARAAVAACWAELLKSDHAQPIRLFRWYSNVISGGAA